MRVRKYVIWTFVFLLAGGLCLQQVRADVTVKRKTKVEMKGPAAMFMQMLGKGLQEQMEISYIKGDMARTESEGEITLTDLKNKRLIKLYPATKTYRVLTFDALKGMMERAPEDLAKDERAREEAAKWDVQVDVKRTGKKARILGFQAEEIQFTITVKRKGVALEDSGGMIIRASQWLAKDVPGAKEAVAFQKRMAEAMGIDLSTSGMGDMIQALGRNYPQLSEGARTLVKELARAEGFPLKTVMTYEVVPGKEQKEEMEKSREKMPDLSKLSKMLGGFGKKLARQQKEMAEGSNVLMEFVTEVIDLSTKSLDPSLFRIPAGYKEETAEY
jgi:hypothetical protein